MSEASAMNRFYVLDLELFRAIHQSLFATPAGSVLAAIQYAGTFWGLAILVPLAIWFGSRERRPEIAARLLVSVVLASLACELMKRAVGEPRPASLVPQLMAPGTWNPSSDVPRHAYSFPSGHTTAIFAFATAVVTLGAPWRAVAAAFAIAALTGLGRVALGAHFPSDVIAGALVGGLVTFLLKPALDEALARFAKRRNVAAIEKPVPAPTT